MEDWSESLKELASDSLWESELKLCLLLGGAFFLFTTIGGKIS